MLRFAIQILHWFRLILPSILSSSSDFWIFLHFSIIVSMHAIFYFFTAGTLLLLIAFAEFHWGNLSQIERWNDKTQDRCIIKQTKDIAWAYKKLVECFITPDLSTSKPKHTFLLENLNLVVHLYMLSTLKQIARELQRLCHQWEWMRMTILSIWPYLILLTFITNSGKDKHLSRLNLRWKYSGFHMSC